MRFGFLLLIPMGLSLVMGCSASQNSENDTAGTNEVDASMYLEGEAPNEKGTCIQHVDCDDGNPCTRDLCSISGRCSYEVELELACDDGDPCTEGAECQADGSCGGDQVAEIKPPVCTICSCDEVEGLQCVAAMAGSPCDDRDCCTQNDRCQLCDTGEEGCSTMGVICGGDPLRCSEGGDCSREICTCE